MPNTSSLAGLGGPPRDLDSALAELRRTQAELLQAQKMESIGELAAGIAHELNTPAQYVLDNLAFLERAVESLWAVLDASLAVTEAARSQGFVPDRVAEVDDARERRRLGYLRRETPRAFAQSVEGMQRIASIVSAVKDLSQPSGHELEPADLSELISGVVNVSRGEWKYVADLETALEPSLPLVPCLRDQLSRVLLNLIQNSVAAIRARGESPRGSIRVESQRLSDCVEVRVADNGCGIPEVLRSRVFDPFFTTKPVGQRSGRGLAFAYRVIVDHHQGLLWFESKPGVGTTFFIRIPIERQRSGVSCA